MVSKIIQDQLAKVAKADLGYYDPKTSTYFIKKRTDIKVEEDKCYLIRLKASAFVNDVVKINWNSGNIPIAEYMRIDVSKCVGKMIKVLGVCLDNKTYQPNGLFWNGWLSISDIEVLSKI